MERRKFDQQIENILRHIPLGISRMDENGVYMYWNLGNEKIFGYTAKEMIDKRTPEFMTKSPSNLKETLERCRIHSNVERELSAFRKDGKEIIIHEYITNLSDEDGKYAGFLSVTQDITGIKWDEEQLRNEKSTLEKIVEAMGAGVSLLDTNLKVVWASKTLKNQPNLPKNPIGMHCHEIYHCDSETRSNCPATMVLDGADGLCTELRIFTEKGEAKYSHIISTPIRDEQGRIKNILVVSMDATEREKRVHQLSLMRQLGEAMQGTLNLDRLLHLILTCVTAGHALGFNRAFLFLVNERKDGICGRMAVGPASADEAYETWQKLTKKYTTLEAFIKEADNAYAKDTPLNIMIKLLVYPLSQEQEVVVSCARQKKPILIKDAMEDPRVTKEFATLWNIKSILGASEFICIPLVARSEVVGVIIADNIYSSTPITEDHVELLTMFANQAALAIENAQAYKRLEDNISELKDMQERLIRSERLAVMGKIATYIAHEIRNPLTTIGGFAQSILRKSTNDNSIKESSQIIKDEVIRLEKILANVMDFAKPQKPLKTLAEINGIIENACFLLESFLKTQGIQIIKKLTPNLPQIKVDPDHIKQVIVNLIKNASESIPNGGTVTIKTVIEDGFIKIDIIDTGAGMTPEVLENIFSPFYTTKAGGTGVGLTVTQQILDEHEGQLKANSKVGKGTTFSVYLPMMCAEKS
ncbi:MAG: ATP-binding protein [Candidatus Brocadiales bacterium]